ncbi:hypothetical protein [Streptomyces sp. NPDC056628]|uniref:hypothetical protein n=1 Tax=Streptomyces sp. NPDC056628 TaxID=3345882 RepID=UPI003698BBF7
MTGTTENDQPQRFCKACGTPAGDGGLCAHCGAVLNLPDHEGLVEDQGVTVRRDLGNETHT